MTLLGLTGVAATALVVALVTWLQPEANAQSHVSIPAAVNVDSNPESIPKPKNIQTASAQIVSFRATTSLSQVELVQQRDSLYQDFQALNFALSHGQQPDTYQVKQMLNQQLRLVQAGVLPREDALTNSRFLKKIMPQMNAEITTNMMQIEQVKLVSLS